MYLRTTVAALTALILCLTTFTAPLFMPADTEGSVIEAFSGGKESDTATITADMGVDATTSITLPRNVTVTDFRFNVTGGKLGGSNAYIPRVDLGADGDSEWAFDGDGYGELGRQFTLSDNTSRKSITFNSPGSNTDMKFKIPQGAQIESAKMQLAGRFKFNSPASKHIIDSYHYRAEGLAMGDLDGDGDKDAVATAYYGSDVTWYENVDGAATSWLERNIDLNFQYAAKCEVVDIDDDGHNDVVVTGGYWTYTDVAWFRNSGAVPPTFTRYDLDSSLYYTWGLSIADINDDGRKDIVTAAYSSSRVQWYENPQTPTNPSSWIRHDIDTSATQARAVDVGDVDDDGDLDVLCARYSSGGSVDWYENKNGLGTQWNKVPIATGSYFVDCNLSDIDNDGDLDAVATQYMGQKVDWYRNVDGGGASWTTHNIASSLNRPYGLHVGDIGGDGYKDVVVCGYFGNWVWWWEAPDRPDQDTWVKNIVDSSLSYAWDCVIGDLSGDGEVDVMATGYLASQVVWYSLSVSFPSDVSIDVGCDGDTEWSHGGQFSIHEYTPDFKDELQQHVDGLTPLDPDKYGVRMVEVPVKLTLDGSTGRIGMYELDVKYDWTTQAQGDWLVDELNELVPDCGEGDIEIYFKVSSYTPGKVELKDLYVEYNERPKPRAYSGPPLTVPEDGSVDHLLDLGTLFSDDYLAGRDLTFEVAEVSYPTEDPKADYVTAAVVEGHWLKVSAERTPNTNWYGPVDMVVLATDDGGDGGPPLTTASESFRVQVTPVNDEPQVGDAWLEPVTFKETEVSTEIDLDSANYFFDVDGDELTYSHIVDPDNTYIGESVSVVIDEITKMVTIGSVEGFTTGVAPVTVRFTADDGKGTTDNDAYQDVAVTIEDVEGRTEPPQWTTIDDLVMDEDTVRYNWVDLDAKVYDPDAKPGDYLELRVSRIANGPGMKVGIDSEHQLDIEPAPDWNGEAQVWLAADDGIETAETSFNITVRPVNDPPGVKIVEPADGKKDKGRIKVTGVAGDLEGLKEILVSISGEEYDLPFTTDNVHGLEVWEYEIDGRELVGPYTVTVRAFDGAESAEDAITIIFGEYDTGNGVVDRDGDGVLDVDDAFPDDPSEQTDTDGDGVGDNADEFPADSAEWRDTDLDSTGDNADRYPLDPNDGGGGGAAVVEDKKAADEGRDWSDVMLYLVVIAVSLMAMAVLGYTTKKMHNIGVQKRIDRRRRELEEAHARKSADPGDGGGDGDEDQ